MSESTFIAQQKISREQLALVPTPAGTATHKPVPHIEVVNALVETLGFRNIAVHADQYAVSKDGNKMFGLIELATNFNGCRFAVGLRNSHDKTMRLAMTVGYKVFMCENMAFNGDFEPILARHSKNFSLISAVSVGVDLMQRNFEGMVRQVDFWKAAQLSNDQAKLIIYEAFIEGELQAAKHLVRDVHDNYFSPKYPEFADRTLWSLSNAFTSAFHQLDPVPQFRATASLGEFLKARGLQAGQRTIDLSPVEVAALP